MSQDSQPELRPRIGKNMPVGSEMNGHQPIPVTEEQADQECNGRPEVKTPVKTIKLITYNELPDWLKDNDYIWSQYRPPLYSLTTCIKSCFMMHTETGNIWSHALGFLLFVALAIHLYFFSGHPLKVQDKILFGVYFVSVFCCLGFSASYHCFTCHSEECARFCRKFDYCGISILITGSFIPWVFYGFQEDKVPRYIYLVIVSTIGVSVSLFSLSDKFGSSPYRHIRAIVFIVFGIATALPFIHFFFFSKDHVPVSVTSLLAFGFYYIFGASLYACRIPERYFPGKCDLFFQSHQIFHCFVVLAAFVHYRNIQEIAFIRLYQ